MGGNLIAIQSQAGPPRTVYRKSSRDMDDAPQAVSQRSVTRRSRGSSSTVPTRPTPKMHPVREVDDCLHEADRDREIKVVHQRPPQRVLRVGNRGPLGPRRKSLPGFGDTFEISTRAPPTFLVANVYLWEFPKPTISQIHATAWAVGSIWVWLNASALASRTAYFQMPLAQASANPRAP